MVYCTYDFPISVSVLPLVHPLQESVHLYAALCEPATDGGPKTTTNKRLKCTLSFLHDHCHNF